MNPTIFFIPISESEGFVRVKRLVSVNIDKEYDKNISEKVFKDLKDTFSEKVTLVSLYQNKFPKEHYFIALKARNDLITNNEILCDINHLKVICNFLSEQSSKSKGDSNILAVHWGGLSVDGEIKKCWNILNKNERKKSMRIAETNYYLSYYSYSNDQPGNNYFESLSERVIERAGLSSSVPEIEYKRLFTNFKKDLIIYFLPFLLQEEGKDNNPIKFNEYIKKSYKEILNMKIIDVDSKITALNECFNALISHSLGQAETRKLLEKLRDSSLYLQDD